jgi:hypothetical protein
VISFCIRFESDGLEDDDDGVVVVLLREGCQRGVKRLEELELLSKALARQEADLSPFLADLP